MAAIKLSERNLNFIAALTLFGFAFVIYVSTLSTTITWENSGADSGELATAVDTLGVAHPPGYPTYIILGKAFAFLPFGEIALRTNLMSAFFAALTVVLLYFIVLEFIELAVPDTRNTRGLKEIFSAVLAATALAVSPLIWSQAVITEVYTLNAFFAAAIVLLLVLRANRGTTNPSGPLADKYLLSAAFLLGVGLGNHMTLALLVPPAVALIAVKWSSRSWITIPSAVLPFLLGLAVYVYLPISAAQDPAVNWGQADGFSGFWWTVSAAPYRDLPFNAPADLWLERLADWWTLLVDQFYYPGVALGLIGAGWLWSRHQLIGLFTISFIALLVIYASAYNTADSHVYLIPGFTIFALWIGLGTYWIIRQVIPWIWAQKQILRHPRAYGPSMGLAIVLIVGLIPIYSLVSNYSDQDLSDNAVASDYGQQVLETVEPNSLVIALNDHHIFSLWYAVFTSDSELQIALVTQDLLQFDWYAENVMEQYPGVLSDSSGDNYHERLPNLIQANLGIRPIYFTDRSPSNDFVFEQFEIEEISLIEDQPLYLVKGEAEASSQVSKADVQR